MAASTAYKLGIVISADASSVKPAAADTKNELASISHSAATTETSLQRLIATAAGLHVGAANSNQRTWTGALAAEGMALDNLRAKYNPMFAVIKQYKSAQTEIRTAHAMGALSADEMTVALQRQRQAALASIDAIKGRNAVMLSANNTNTGNPNAPNYAATNAMFQLQDIGVTAAMGMSPAMIALQQGTQLAGNFSGMGMKEVGTTMVGAFTRLLSPVALATIAVTGLSAAAIQYFMTSEKETDKASKAIENHETLIRRLRDAYGDAAIGAREYADESKNILGQDTVDQIRDYRTSIGDITSGLLDKTSGWTFDAFEGKTYLIGEATSAIAMLKKTAAEGGPDIQGFVDKLIDIENHPAVPEAIRKTTRELREQAKEGKNTQRALEKLLEIQKSLSSQRGPLIGSQAEKDRFSYLDAERVALDEMRKEAGANRSSLYAQSPAEKAAAARQRAALNRNGTGDEYNLRIELAGQEALLAAEKDLADAKRDRIKALNDTVAGQQLELLLIGKTVSEAEALRMEYQLISQLKAEAAKNGVAVDEQEVALIKAKARAFGDLAEQISATNMLRDQSDEADQLRLELSLIGAGEVARRRAISALEAEQALKRAGFALESEFGKVYQKNAAAMTDARIALDRHTDAWSRYQSAGESAIDAIFDGLFSGKGNIEDIVENLASDLTKSLTELAIKNPLKNGLFGTNYGTLSDLIGGNQDGGMLSSLLGGATSTGSMNVQAAIVNIGGVGIGGANGLASTVSRAFGAANSNTAFPSAGTTQTGIALGQIGAQGLTAKVSSEYASRFQGLLDDLTKSGYNISSLGEGGYSFRNVAGTNTLSRHALGEAIDINPRSNPWSSVFKTDLPSNINEMAKNNGLTWGGTWNKPDTMHFQVDKTVTALKDLDMTTTSATQNLGQFGGGLEGLARNLAGMGGGGGGFNIGSLFPGAGGFKSNQLAGAIASGVGGLWSTGGYTGPGAVDDPRGIVHAGEVVWSQRDVARAGGPQVVDAMRLGRRGYSGGGVVDGERVYRAAPSGYFTAASTPAQQQPPAQISIHNYAGADVRTEEESDGRGGKRTNIIVEESVSDALSRQGSSAKNTMGRMYGMRAKPIKY